PRLQEVVDLAKQQGVEVLVGEVRHEELADQGVALVVKTPQIRSESLLDDLIGVDSPLFLMLDGVTDPRNLGACLRSAASFGVSAVVAPKDRSAPLNEAAVKTASGAASLVPYVQVTNLGRTLEHLKKAGIWVVGTVLADDSQPLPAIDLTGPLAMVMGAEGTGIRAGIRKKCDFLAEIPAPLPDLSLNVAVASGICLYEVNQQRGRR
ncbi:MAG: 23S rRNA (guanosine(2251)-2'-O)-methyltransferase RlmB, partial [Pseudomonadales bacterium]